MKIAVIGATGAMGSALTKSLSKAGHELYVFAPHAGKLETFVEAVREDTPRAKITKCGSAQEAAALAEVIIAAVWYSVQEEVADAIRKEAKNKIVLNIANPLNETFDGLATSAGTSAAEEMAKLLPESRIVKGFNTAFAGDYSSPEFGGIRPDIFVASDDEKAAEVVSGLVKDAGFNPLYSGKLFMSRTLESMMLLLIGLTNRYGYNWLAGWKVLHK